MHHDFECWEFDHAETNWTGTTLCQCHFTSIKSKSKSLSCDFSNFLMILFEHLVPLNQPRTYAIRISCFLLRFLPITSKKNTHPSQAKLRTAGWSASSGLIISISIPSLWKSPRKDSPRRSTRIVRPFLMFFVGCQLGGVLESSRNSPGKWSLNDFWSRTPPKKWTRFVVLLFILMPCSTPISMSTHTCNLNADSSSG